jgi:flagellar biogenesis protein FliO
MKKKRTAGTSKKLSNTKLMFLSIILLFIVFEALYVMKAQNSLQANSQSQSVAGASTHK